MTVQYNLSGGGDNPYTTLPDAYGLDNVLKIFKENSILLAIILVVFVPKGQHSNNHVSNFNPSQTGPLSNPNRSGKGGGFEGYFSILAA